MKFTNLTLVLAISSFFAGCNTTDTATTNQTQPRAPASPAASAIATPDEFASARTNFGKHCAACHGNEGKGGPVTVDGEKLKVPSLREGHALNHKDEQFVKQINNGGDGMPKFKDKLKPEEIADLVRFIRQDLQGGQAVAMKPEMKMN